MLNAEIHKPHSSPRNPKNDQKTFFKLSGKKRVKLVQNLCKTDRKCNLN